ncbi:hypothetical protein H6764_03590 [Candidatus Nomurabacteria bacterium]|nr:hypothetical protein [Candidatus Nomurabacteria bacterium]
MVALLIGIILTLITLFAENILFSIGSFSILIVVSMFLFEKRSNVMLFTVLLIVSCVLDTHYHLYIGSFYFAVLVAFTVYSILKRVLPSTVMVSKATLLFISFLFYHLTVLLVAFYQTQGEVKTLNSIGVDLVRSIPLGIFEVFLFFLIDYIVNEVFISKTLK